MNTDKCLIVSLNVFSVCKEPSRDPSAAAPFRGVLSNVEGKKGKDRKGGCNKDQTRVGVNILGSRVDTRKLRFFCIPSLQPYLEVSPLSSWWVQQRLGGCVCAYVCVCKYAYMHFQVSTATSLAWNHEVNP